MTAIICMTLCNQTDKHSVDQSSDFFNSLSGSRC